MLLNAIISRSNLDEFMTRMILVGCTVLLVACASGPPDSPPGSGFPRNADVDPRLNLSGSDRTQIARLVAAQTSDPIRMAWRAGNPNKIVVTCGSVNLAHPLKAFAKGPGFLMQRTGSIWKITDRLEINSTPGTPGVEPIAGASGFKPYGL